MSITMLNDRPESQPATVKADLEGFAGELLGPEDAGYDAARSLWNAMIDRRPALIARCRGVADIQDALSLARRSGLTLAVRGGGHNIAGTALCDHGIVIDLSAMHGVRVDPELGTVRVGPGCRWCDVDHETQRFGMAVPSGIVSTTGVAGLTLGGGFGWLSRKYGLTSDNLLSVDMVLADGRYVRASEEENADLFWAVRGGGGNFGIVTSFEFRLRPVGPDVVAGMVVHPFEDADRVIDLYREITGDAPDDLTLMLILRLAPPAPFLPEAIHGRPVAAIAACHAGTLDEGHAAMRPLKETGQPVADLIAAKPFSKHQQMLDAVQPHGRHYYWKSECFDHLARPLAETMKAATARITSPHSSLLFFQLGGAIDRVEQEKSAAALRGAGHLLNIAGSWTEPGETDRHIAWVRDAWQAARPEATGTTYVNFLSEGEGAERVGAAYGPQLGRLARIKATYDPENLFRTNQNIPPRP